jgi:hypothetical protein
MILDQQTSLSFLLDIKTLIQMSSEHLFFLHSLGYQDLIIL